MRMRGRARPRAARSRTWRCPPRRSVEFLQRLQNILKAHDVSWTIDAHAGQGQFTPARSSTWPTRATWPSSSRWRGRSTRRCSELGGTISGEHGCGLRPHPVPPPPVRRARPGLPRGQGRIRPAQRVQPRQGHRRRSHLMTARPEAVPAAAGADHDPIRLAPGARARRRVLAAEQQATERSIETVGGAQIAVADPRFCRSCAGPTAAPVEMALGLQRLRRLPHPASRRCGCARPSGRSRPEAATPRAKANLIRQLAAGAIDPKLWGTEEFKANADLCIHCNLCPTECPAGVDVSSLMLEAKAAFVENHGLPPGDWMLSRVELWSRLASRLPILCNVLMTRRGRHAGWSSGCSASRGTGAAAGPSHAVRPPGGSGCGMTQAAAARSRARASSTSSTSSPTTSTRSWPRRSWPCSTRPRSTSSSLPPARLGDARSGRRRRRSRPRPGPGNLRVLGNAVRDGYTIVCSEPTAALMLRQEYLKLTDDLDAALVAENTMDLGQYLAGLDTRGQLPRPHRSAARAGGLPPALPPPGTRRRDARPRPDPRDPRARRRIHQPRNLPSVEVLLRR